MLLGTVLTFELMPMINVTKFNQSLSKVHASREIDIT